MLSLLCQKDETYLVDVLNKLKKIQSLPPQHSLKVCFEKWKKCLSFYERVDERATNYSFFGFAVATFKRIFKTDFVLEPLKLLPVKPQLPWYPERPQAQNQLGEFRKRVTEKVRQREQTLFDESKSNMHYKSLKNTCLPLWPHQHLPSRSLSSILFKLRAGYCKIGDAQHYRPYPACPGCGDDDSIHH